MPTGGVDNFVAWDSGSTKADATTSAGVSIPSDWDFDSGLSGGVDVNIKTTVKGVGTFDDGGSGYSSVLVKGKIVVNKIGYTDTTVSLKLPDLGSILPDPCVINPPFCLRYLFLPIIFSISPL